MLRRNIKKPYPFFHWTSQQAVANIYQRRACRRSSEKSAVNWLHYKVRQPAGLLMRVDVVGVNNARGSNKNRAGIGTEGNPVVR